MDKISRTKTRILIICFFEMAGCIIAAFITKKPAFVLGLLLGYAVFIVLRPYVLKCPHCGRSMRSFYWSKPDAGVCRRCGKKMEYDR